MIRIVFLEGLSEYRAVHRLQKALVEQVAAGEPSTILILQHEPTITVGRSKGALANVIAAGDWPVVEIERGGDVTIHLPGQLVAYPIIKLENKERDLHKHLRRLENAVMNLCQDLGVFTQRDERNTGVWISQSSGLPKKVCSIGIACRRWVTYHGLALNVDVDLLGFNRINPCGFASDVMDRLQNHVQEQNAQSLAPQLAEKLAAVFERPYTYTSVKTVKQAANFLGCEQ